MNRSMVLRVVVASATATLALPAEAQQPPGETPRVALTAPGSPTQQILAVESDAAGIRVAVCMATPCVARGAAKVISWPADAELAKDKAHVAPLTLRGGATVVRVDVPGKADGPSWVVLVAAPKRTEAPEPVVVWQGLVEEGKGEEGEQHGSAVVVEPEPDHGAVRILLGEHREDVTICGRPTLVAAREVDPATFALLAGAPVQNLSASERARATKLNAERVGESDAATPTGVRLLRATAASSAVGKRFATLTDGDPNTSWSENRKGPGTGEFVSMSSASEVEITGFDIVVRGDEDVDDGAAPRRFYLATPDRLFEVTMPEDAWRKPPGTKYRVKLNEGIHASCVAVVLDQAFASEKKPDTRVTLAEIEAKTAFDGMAPVALVKALGGGGDRARAAAALLARSGGSGFDATIQGYDQLDEPGKQLATSVVDAAPCSSQVRFFGAIFANRVDKAANAHTAPEDADLIHARDRLRRCGQASAEVLGKLVLDGASERVRRLAAEELAALAPAEAVPVLVNAMSTASEEARKSLRAALARAATSPRARVNLAEALAAEAQQRRSETVAIDVLRAVGPNLGRVDGAEASFAAIATPSASFRTRYLLVEPASLLATAGSAKAEAWLRQTLLRDPEPHVRARAASAAFRVRGLIGDLTAVTVDPEVRVREAAVLALGELASERGGTTSAVPAGDLAKVTTSLVQRLLTDSWTFVRAAAARTLGALPGSPDLDGRLSVALENDEAPDVRSAVLDALATHRATAYLESIRRRQNDSGEAADVRVHAILALAALCDAAAVDAWTKLATEIRVPIDEGERRIQSAAITALGQVHPPDLAARLGTLLAKETPAPVRELVKSAIASAPACGAGSSGP